MKTMEKPIELKCGNCGRVVISFKNENEFHKVVKSFIDKGPMDIAIPEFRHLPQGLYHRLQKGEAGQGKITVECPLSVEIMWTVPNDQRRLLL